MICSFQWALPSRKQLHGLGKQSQDLRIAKAEWRELRVSNLKLAAQ
eukprot:CAMPEP_0180630674 /NCGR_PEP_ID=MMETSP1037_2-20121125/40121_1 /TAXON_ID=632150 /ORGANISM="Azadinium spinosum, Strain 3D9" /LENGTH=45 /DNA_ID= /DNA_START= /DNA_END= /DNA_ORIENTATION=